MKFTREECDIITNAISAVRQGHADEAQALIVRTLVCCENCGVCSERAYCVLEPQCCKYAGQDYIKFEPDPY